MGLRYVKDKFAAHFNRVALGSFLLVEWEVVVLLCYR